MREEFAKILKVGVIIFSIILLFLYFRDDVQDLIDEQKMNRHIKAERELHKNDVPNNVTRGIHPRPDTTRKDTIRNGNN